ncbi:PEP-CTERM sorting domain-containing protein [Akkermansiaceae bacterium]|nr:PEP-CTERM sorting domain-containing protein [Akkermansiaceae bacterium]MDB4541614.1 PEP-CTERM sorting domain-containing protein [Akkermansiaceae bacterium]
MKKTTSILASALALSSMSASGAVLVAGWDAFSSGLTPTSNHEAADITATMVNTGWSNGGSEDRGSSSDTTWGSFDGNGTAASAAIVGTVNLTAHNGEIGNTMTITITNNSANNLNLAEFHMDALAFRPNASRTWTLDVGGSNVHTSAEQSIISLGAAPNAAQDQHDEYDISLAGTTVAAGGGSVDLVMTISGGTPGSAGHHLWVDNIAVSGDFATIPEPSSALLALVSGAFLLRRRR